MYFGISKYTDILGFLKFEVKGERKKFGLWQRNLPLEEKEI